MTLNSAGIHVVSAFKPACFVWAYRFLTVLLSSGLWEKDRDEVERGRAFSGLRIVLGYQRLETHRSYADVDMGKAVEIWPRDIAFEAVCSRSIGDNRCPVCVFEDVA